MRNKGVAELAKETGYTKAYISMILSGKRECPEALRPLLTPSKLTSSPQAASCFPSSKSWVRIPSPAPAPKAAKALHAVNFLEAFVNSRKGERGLTPQGERWIRQTLGHFLGRFPNPLAATREDVEGFLAQVNGPWNKHSHFRGIRAFYNWLEAQGYVQVSPCHRMKAPKLPTPLLCYPSLAQVERLVAQAASPRDKAIIMLLADTGLRRSEVASISPDRVDWDRNTIRVLGKGRKERLVKFSSRTRQYLEQHLGSYSPNGNIWGLNTLGIQTMLRRLQERTGIKCNAHSFRRLFAIELRKRGIDSQTVQYLGGWESLEMVERYSRAAKQEIALSEYVPLTENVRADDAIRAYRPIMG